MLFLLLIMGFFSACGSAELEEQLKKAETELADTKKMLAALQADPSTADPGFIHTVLFYFNEGVSEADKATFMDGVRSLGKIESVRNLWVGPPAMTPREVVDNSYDMALIVHFDDKAGHDLYQEAQIHLDFIEASKHVWNRVQIYDALIE